VFTATLDRALELGINHLETARGYGNSEVFLGRYLQRQGVRERVYLTTKLVPTPDRQTMEKAIAESLERLQLNYLDCLAIHGINTREHLNWIKDPQGCMKAVFMAQEAGKIGHIGFSTHAPLEIILETINTDFFAFVNIHYYFFWQRQQPAIALARAKDMGVFIISPADKGGGLHRPPKKLEELCAPFSPLELNYRFLLSDPRITTLSVGAAIPEELEAIINVCEGDQPLDAAEIAVFKRLEAHLTDKLATDLCSQCYQCLPCPENINIPEVLRLRNLAVAYEMTDFGQYRYRMLENAGHWFPGRKANNCTECGDCLPRCPEKLPIPRLLFDTHELLKGPAQRRLWSS
jgi:predicted aldo/keto reductase-like oxidoreductase